MNQLFSAVTPRGSSPLVESPLLRLPDGHRGFTPSQPKLQRKLPASKSASFPMALLHGFLGRLPLRRHAQSIPKNPSVRGTFLHPRGRLCINVPSAVVRVYRSLGVSPVAATPAMSIAPSSAMPRGMPTTLRPRFRAQACGGSLLQSIRNSPRQNPTRRLAPFLSELSFSSSFKRVSFVTEPPR